MGRSGYTEDHDTWELIKWRGQVASAIRGERGQKFLRDLIAALDAIPEKRLIKGRLVDEGGGVCALGAVGKFRGLDMEKANALIIEEEDEDWPDPLYTNETLGDLFDIAHQLAAEVQYENDEASSCFLETPEGRWYRVRRWAERNLIEWEK